jgi:hypothetical protein
MEMTLPSSQIIRSRPLIDIPFWNRAFLKQTREQHFYVHDETLVGCSFDVVCCAVCLMREIIGVFYTHSRGGGSRAKDYV